jgi:RNA polymerase sigma-70 factor, ECF subfamily
VFRVAKDTEVTSMQLSRKDINLQLNPNDLLEELMSDYGEELTRTAYPYLKDWSLAEDAVQESFIKLYKNLHTFRGDASIKTWVYKILTNTCKDILRSATMKKVVLGNLFDYKGHTEKSAEYTILNNESGKELAQSVLNLPLKYREVIILFYYQSFSTKEISQLLSITESTVRVRLNRGREKLRRIMGRDSNDY